MRTIRDSMDSRAQFDPDEIADMLARSRTINESPLDYTRGMSVTGSQGACVPLPPGSASEIGRASCRERVCQYVLIPVVAVSLKKKTTTNKKKTKPSYKKNQ